MYKDKWTKEIDHLRLDNKNLARLDDSFPQEIAKPEDEKKEKAMTLFERFYDADYEKARDKLIPKAEAKANRNFGKTCKIKGNIKESLKWAAQWSKSYHAEMNRLVDEAGLRK